MATVSPPTQSSTHTYHRERSQAQRTCVDNRQTPCKKVVREVGLDCKFAVILTDDHQCQTSSNGQESQSLQQLRRSAEKRTRGKEIPNAECKRSVPKRRRGKKEAKSGGTQLNVAKCGTRKRSLKSGG